MATSQTPSNAGRADRDLLIEMNTKLEILIQQSKDHSVALDELRDAHGRRIKDVEDRLTRVEENRKALLPEWEKMKLDVAQHSKAMHELDGAFKSGKLFAAVVSFLMMIAGVAGGYAASKATAPAQASAHTQARQ